MNFCTALRPNFPCIKAFGFYILSPTLFIILLADIELWCPGAELCGYADDTTCTVYDTNINNLQDKCEEKVNQLLTYMAINRLAANDDKTKILVMKHGN